MGKRQNPYLIRAFGLILSLAWTGCDRASDHAKDETINAAHHKEGIHTARAAVDELPYSDIPALQLRLAGLLDGDQRQLRLRMEGWKKLPPEKSGPLVLALARLGRGELALEVIRDWPPEAENQAIALIFSGLAGHPADQWLLADSLKEDQHKLACSELLKKGAQEDSATWCELAWQHRDQLKESASWQTCLTAWSEKDPAAFGSWLNDHALPDQLHDATVQLLVMRADAENRSAETAVAWAETVHDPRLRLSTLEHALSELCREKNCTPQEAITACDHLSEAEKSTLLDQLSQERKPDFSPPD
jgi:hypothetical protein